MTCSKNFDRVLQATCLGLVSMLAIAGCGGSSNPVVVDAGKDGGGVTPPIDGPAPATLKVSPPSVNFGSVDIGDSSPDSVVTVTSTAAVVVNPTVTGAGFLIDTTTCGTASLSCTISVKFSPASVGGVSGILNIATGLTVSLSGQGTPAGTFTVTPSVIPTTLLVNQSLPVSVTVTATKALTDLSCLASGGDLAAAPATTTCTGNIAANTPCVYAYTFKAATAGDKSDSIVCSSGGVVKTVPVAPTVVTGASLTINPNSGTFSGSVGQTSPALTFNVANVGGSVSGVLTTAPLSGTNAGDFAIVDNKCVVPLAPSTTCAIQVVFKPTAVGARTATLTVTDATAGSTPATATLNGTAILGTNLAITGAASLGNVEIGKPGTASTYTITNSGGTASGALTVAAGPQFAIGSDLCTGLALAAAKTCTFTVTFTPTSAGVQSAVLSASSGGVALAQLMVQGTGVPILLPNLTMAPATLDFGTIGVGTVSGTKTFTVTNTGATATAVLSVVKKDSTSSVGGASQFSYTTTCQAALAAAASCQVVVTFSPTIAGSASATISVTDGAVSTPAANGTVVGIALNRPGITISCGGTTSSTFLLPDTVVGKTSAPVVCTVTNTPSSTQDTGALTAKTTGEYAVATNNCTTSLAPGLSCTLSITFSPTAKGKRDGSITVTGANGGATNVNLTGTGLGVVEIVEYANCTLAGHALPACTPQVQPFDFGQTTVGTNSDTTLTLAVFVRASVGNLSVTTAFGTPEEFTISNGCSSYASTAPAAPFSNTVPLCLITVQHKPVSRTVANGTVTVAGASTDSDSATMKGTGTGPLTISPSPATFSNVATGTASNTLMLTVRNNGALVSINGASFTLTGANANQFSVVVDNLTGSNIAAGDSKTIGVRFIPTAVGGAAATITVTGTRSDSAAIETATDNLIGNGATGAAMTVTISNNGAFADTYAGATSAPLTITVANATGSLPTGMVAFLLDSDDFTTTPPTTSPPTLQGTCAGATTNPVNGGASCTEFVWFRPDATSALAARSASLTVTASPGATVDLPLTGNALPQLTIAPAGPATAPVDLGAVVIDTSTTPSATFTVTNHAESAIVAGGLTVALAASPNMPNRTSLFVVDTSATNGCSSVVAGGGTCTFKVTASAVSPTHAVTPVDLGVFFAEVQASTGTGGVQMAKADIKATVVARAALSFTPATDSVGTRDIGAVQRGAAIYSTPILYTLVNTGGVNSGPITVNLYAVGTTNPLTKPSDWGLATGTTCTGLPETGLAPGATCDILVAFHPTVDNPAPTALSPVDLSVKNTAGIPLTGELRRTIQGTGVAAGPYLVDSVTKLAPSYMGAPTGTVFTRTIELHAGSAAITPTAFTVSEGSIAAGGTCAVSTQVLANAFCTLNVSLDTAVGGWHVLTASVTSDGPTASMNLLAKVPGAPNLLASSDTLAFGLLPVGVASAQQTITITNIGEATTTALVVTPTSTTLIKTSGTCTPAGTTLAYLASCNLNVWVVPAAAPAANPVPSQVVVSATNATLTNRAVVDLTWTGAGPAALGTAALATDFGKQAVLSKTTGAGNPVTFTFANAADALPTGPLSISVLNGTAVVPDFVITGDSTCLAAASGLGNGESCTVIVQFTPRSLTTPAKAGTLTVTATPGGSATVALTGTAIAALSVSAPGMATATDGTKSLDVGSVKSGTMGSEITVTFTNEVGAPKTGLLSMALSGANAGEFLVTSDGCTGTQIASSTATPPVPGSCTVTLKFAPKTVATGKTATITVSGTPGNSAALVLNGVGSAI